MVYKKRKSEVQGLWCRKDKTFYYYETGLHSVRNPLDRIKNTLITRGLLEYDISGTRRFEEPIIKMSWAEAEEQGFNVMPIYLNSHVKAQVEADGGDTTNTKSPWG